MLEELEELVELEFKMKTLGLHNGKLKMSRLLDQTSVMTRTCGKWQVWNDRVGPFVINVMNGDEFAEDKAPNEFI